MAKANKNRCFIEMRSFQQKIMSFTKHRGSEAPKDEFFCSHDFPWYACFLVATRDKERTHSSMGNIQLLKHHLNGL